MDTSIGSQKVWAFDEVQAWVQRDMNKIRPTAE